MKQPIPEVHEGYRVVTAAQMAELDRRAIAEFGIPSLDLMENAGRGVAEEAARLLAERGAKSLDGTLITVCCGRGNNGGDGLVAARYLKERGAEVMVFLVPAKRDRGYPAEVQANLSRAGAAGVSVHYVPAEAMHDRQELVELDIRLRSSALLVDALLGTGAAGRPKGPVTRVIERITRSGKPVLAVDIPSGLHPDTGYHSGVVIKAELTATLGLPKRGLLAGPAKPYVGRLRVLDIGYPRQLLA